MVSQFNAVNEHSAAWLSKAVTSRSHRSRVGIANGFIGRRGTDAPPHRDDVSRRDAARGVLIFPRTPSFQRGHDRDQAPRDTAPQPVPLLLPALRDATIVEHLRSRCAGRILTGCVYQRLPPASRGVLIERAARFTGPHAHYAEWWPGVAPSPRLREAYAVGRISWESLAERYRAELEHWPGGLLALWRHLAALLDHHPTVTLLGTASSPDGNEQEARCARRVLHAWLLGEVARERLTAA